MSEPNFLALYKKIVEGSGDYSLDNILKEHLAEKNFLKCVTCGHIYAPFDIVDKNAFMLYNAFMAAFESGLLSQDWNEQEILGGDSNVADLDDVEQGRMLTSLRISKAAQDWNWVKDNQEILLAKGFRAAVIEAHLNHKKLDWDGLRAKLAANGGMGPFTTHKAFPRENGSSAGIYPVKNPNYEPPDQT